MSATNENPERIEIKERKPDCGAASGSATATRNRFLDNLSGMTGKEMWTLLSIETVDELAELYVECVHQKRPDDVREMVGFVLHAKLVESRSWPNDELCEQPPGEDAGRH